MTIRDVIIIGGGASGSTAAYHLAKNKHKVTILEKNSAHLIKPCGGGMSAAVQQWFPFDLSPIVDEIIEKVEFTWCLNDRVIADLPGSSPFWIVKRENLDLFLINEAIDSGAEVLTSFNVINIKKFNNLWKIKAIDGRELETKAVVIADGSNSPWSQKFKLGPNQLHHASTYSIRLQGNGLLKKRTARFEFGLVKNGFAWAFPLKDEINVGVGTFIGDNQSSIPIEGILEKLLPNLGFNPKEGKKQKASLRVWNGHHSLNGEGIILIGDAASLCDPFLAEGLRPAILSGYEAAKSLNMWLKGDIENLDSYSIAIKKKWGYSMAWAKRISQVFYRFPKIGYNLGIKRPTAPKRIAQILSGEMGYEDIAQRVLKRLILRSKVN